MTGKRILLLGGTGDARQLARRLGPDPIYSLAGLGRAPAGLTCSLRVGGFGGVEGLCSFIEAESIGLILDMTHPYAAQMSRHAAQAARLRDIDVWAFRRAPWTSQPGDDWRYAADFASVTEMIRPYKNPFWTTGREPLSHLDAIPETQHWTIRCLESNESSDRATIIAERGPFALEAERALFNKLSIDVLISKNSGGEATEAKLSVARERGIPVIMVQRPGLPPVDREFTQIDALYEALNSTSSPTSIFNKVP